MKWAQARCCIEPLSLLAFLWNRGGYVTQPTPVHAPDLVAKYYTRLFEEKDFAAIPIEFSIDVLSRYREQGNTMIRTRSAGRVEGDGWRIDFGIVDAEGCIHAAAGDIMKLPLSERRHWAQYARSQGLNGRFLKMRLGLGACVDEGDIEVWDGRPRSE